MKWELYICLIILPSFLCFKEDHHHNNTEVEHILQAVHSNCSHITKLHTLVDFKNGAKTTNNNTLTVIEFGSPPGLHIKGRPEFKYIGNMHGNEVVSREILLGLVVHLCKKWREGDAGIKSLISRTRIHILVTMNPDGWEIATKSSYRDRNRLTGRRNANDIDLNRNFPRLDVRAFLRTFKRAGKIDHILQRGDYDYNMAIETEMVIRWMLPIPFVLSANLHGGELVANFPYDVSMSLSPGHQVYSATPDDKEFVRLSHVYANNHLKMSTTHCKGGRKFKDGITNGGLWYTVVGGMQDFNYLATNCFELTLEVSCIKYPNASALPQYHKDNLPALLAYIWEIHSGVKGTVYQSGVAVEGARITVVNVTGGIIRENRHAVVSGEFGDYYRLLTDGKYRITAEYKGNFDTKCVTIQNNPRVRGAKVVNFNLTPGRKTTLCCEQPKPCDSECKNRKLLQALRDFIFFRKEDEE